MLGTLVIHTHYSISNRSVNKYSVTAPLFKELMHPPQLFKEHFKIRRTTPWFIQITVSRIEELWQQYKRAVALMNADARIELQKHIQWNRRRCRFYRYQTADAELVQGGQYV